MTPQLSPQLSPVAIKANISAGGLSQTQPTQPRKRWLDSEVDLLRTQEADLPEIAAILYEEFPEWFWQKFEKAEERPSREIRNARMAKRLLPYLAYHGMHAIKAVIRSTNELAGFAGWHGPERATFEGMFGHAPALALQGTMGWSDEEHAEIWAAVDMKAWRQNFEQNDNIRREVLGDERHWYLAPLVVKKKFQGRGVGTRLMQYAHNRADSTTPPTPLYLEAFPNARPVYLHLGWKGFEEKGREVAMLRRGESRSQMQNS